MNSCDVYIYWNLNILNYDNIYIVEDSSTGFSCFRLQENKILTVRRMIVTFHLYIKFSRNT